MDMDSANFNPSVLEQLVTADSPLEEALDDHAPASCPWILDTLLRNFDFDLERVADIIDPILTVQNHCQCTALYVQGISVQDQAFVTTNLNAQQIIQVSRRGTSWCIGNSPHCAIWIPVQDLSPRHAVLTFDLKQGFFLADLGSEQGVWVNQRRLELAQPHRLADGDLIELGTLGFEFFIDSAGSACPGVE